MYQPRRRNGRDIGTPARPAAPRYEAIARELDGQSGLRVLDLGAHEGYFALRLAEKFDCHVTAVDDWRGLRPALEEAGDQRVTGIYERITPESLAGLGDWDVILCLSVLHHVPWWEQMLTQIRAQSRLLVCEVAVAHEVLPRAVAHCPEIPDAVKALGGRIIARTPGYRSRKLRPMYAIGDLG
ncbi:class I SAM-dependent methyltransferase [Streptomyces bacillaris]|uniref:class I SAM-dependent methyltransferase n=1 Tax=Streptomyces bacillaris TaxID=68179 RepID=UPI003660B8FC